MWIIALHTFSPRKLVVFIVFFTIVVIVFVEYPFPGAGNNSRHWVCGINNKLCVLMQLPFSTEKLEEKTIKTWFKKFQEGKRKEKESL